AAKHRDANAVLRTKTLGRIFTPRDPETEWNEFNWLHSDSILDSEPPKHTRLRSLVGKAFSRSRIESLKPEIERLAGLLLDQAEAKLNNAGSFDLIADYAEPLPVKVIAALLGFPDEDEHLLRPWSQAIVKMYEVNPSEESQAEARTAAHEFAEYVRTLMLERKANPGEDLISELASVEEAGEKLNTQELIATCVLLLNAGHEASVNGFRDESIFENQEQLDLTRENNPQIGFGAGIHFCLGAPLARLELSVSLPMLFERFPAIQLAQAPIRRATFVLRGYETIPVKLGQI
ncbi:MAG: cytochrome P450, partial [Micrococcales bacterium]|nr:cytochrome P450 [Micrococcales bacterium]